MRLRIRDLAWSAGRGAQAVPILHGVDLDVADGLLTGIVGPNGCGKTTLLHLVAGLRRPTRGTVEADGEDLLALTARDRAQRVALVEQHPQTGLDLAARQVVELGRIPHLGRWGSRRERGGDVVVEAMATSGVAHLADRAWTTLSGGERQRVQLARALAQQPRLLLLDEPTNHLDLAHQIGLLTRVADLPVTTVAVLHDLDLAAAFCDHLVVMHAGRVLAAGPTAEVLRPELVAAVFGVDVRVEAAADDRLRVQWRGLTEVP